MRQASAPQQGRSEPCKSAQSLPLDPAGAHPEEQKRAASCNALVALLSHSLFTVREVAAALGVCTALVYRACASGELRHVRVGSAIRIAPEHLEALLARERR